MTLTGRRSALLALVAMLVLVGMAFAAKTWILGAGGSPPNSPAAQALYWWTLQELVAQPRFLLTETFHQQLPSEMTPMHTGGSIYALYRIRHTAPNWIQVTKTEQAMIAITSLQLVMDGNTFCVGDGGDSFPMSSTCSPRHPISTPLYISDYLLGGRVDHLRFSSSPATLTTEQRRRKVILIRISGRGTLGCTPAYAGSGTRTGYHWCEPSDVPGSPQIAATLVADSATGLPLRFTASGSAYGKPNNVTADFAFGGRYTIRLPRARHVVCLSWIPAVHCIELGHRTGKT